jgi:hypothetical protein
MVDLGGGVRRQAGDLLGGRVGGRIGDTTIRPASISATSSDSGRRPAARQSSAGSVIAPVESVLRIVDTG